MRDLRAEAVDHVLLTGDIVNFSLPEEFRQAAGWLSALGPAERISLVPGNHDALVAVPAAEGLDLWKPWTRLENGWPFVHRLDGLALIGLNSALPTAPLLARGALGAAQLARLEQVLLAEDAARRVRIVMAVAVLIGAGPAGLYLVTAWQGLTFAWHTARTIRLGWLPSGRGRPSA